MPERHDHRFVPHFQIGVKITATLTGMRGAAGGEYRFTIPFGHGSERQHFEAVDGHGRNLHPVGECLRGDAFGHAVGPVWQIMLELEGEDAFRERVERFVRCAGATVLCDEIEHFLLDDRLLSVEFQGFLRCLHVHYHILSVICRIASMMLIILLVLYVPWVCPYAVRLRLADR